MVIRIDEGIRACRCAPRDNRSFRLESEVGYTHHMAARAFRQSLVPPGVRRAAMKVVKGMINILSEAMALWM